MNKFKFLIPILAIALTLGACHDDDSSDDSNDATLDDVQVLDSGSVNLYDYYTELLQNSSSANSEGDDALKLLAENRIKQLQNYADSVAEAEGANGVSGAVNSFLTYLNISYCVVNVKTTGADGSDIVMSTLLVWPKRLWPIPDPKPDHVLLGTHITIASDEERPTNFKNLSRSTDVSMMACEWAAHGLFDMTIEALVIMPDYEGYGSTFDRTHPYLNREVQAKQCADAIQRGIAWFESNKKKLEKDYKVVTCGYSQGGAVSAATYRYCLEHDICKGHLGGAVCGDGPYDPYETLYYYCNTNEIAMPVAPTLVVKGLCDSDDEMKAAGCTPADFLTSSFIATGIIDRIAAKKYNTEGCDAAVDEYAKKHPDEFKKNSNGYYTADQILKKEVIEYMLNGTLPTDATLAHKLETMKHCLQKNALWYADGGVWTPPAGAKFTFFHSKRDEVVPCSNMNSIGDKWGWSNSCCKYIEYDTDTHTHVGTGTAFFAWYYGDYVSEIYRNKWKAGNYHFTGEKGFSF